YRERDHPDSLRDVGDGSAQHGHRGARRPSAEPPQPRGQAIAVTPKYKLLALDLDGTIIDTRLNLDPRDVDALAQIIGAGVEVIACTGRPFPGALPWVRRLGLDGPIVCYQGAQVRLPS